MTARSLARLLPLCAALAVACTSDAGIAPKLADPPVPSEPRRILTTLHVSPESSLLVAGSNQSLQIEARDQFGARMLEAHAGEWSDSIAFVSSDPEIASVSKSGYVTAVAPGMARITASLRLAGVTAAASMTTSVTLPSADPVVLTGQPGGRWSPSTVSVRAGATVTWVIPDGVQIGTIWLNVWEPNPEKLEFIGGVATHTFSKPGTFYYGTGGGLMWDEEGGRVLVY